MRRTVVAPPWRRLPPWPPLLSRPHATVLIGGRVTATMFTLYLVPLAIRA